MFPAMKFALLMSVGVATRLLTSTTAPLLKVIPLGLISTTCPFAVSLPAITEGSPGCTRLRVTELAAGCWKFVCSLGAMLKLCQSIAARLVDWTMSSCVGLAWVMVAEPVDTWPPFGLAEAGATVTDRAPATIAAAPNEVETAATGFGPVPAPGPAARRGACAQLPRTTRLIRSVGCGRQSRSSVHFGLLLALCTSPTNIPCSDSARSRTSAARLAINRLSSQPVLSRNGLCCQMDLR